MSKILRYKLVKIRKPHVCFACGRCFEPPCGMISAAAAYDGTVESYYLCESCDKVASSDLESGEEFGFGDLREAALEYEKEQNTIVKGKQND